MIVIDASAMVEALVGRDVEASLLDALAGDVAAPHLLDIEVVSVLRGLVLGHKLPQPSPEAALSHSSICRSTDAKWRHWSGACGTCVTSSQGV